jgi:hypothetical protein
VISAGEPATASEPGRRIPDRPSIVGSLKAAASDFYFNSWRMVPANTIWGALLLIVLFLTATWLPLILLFALLAVPTAGMYRLAALIERGESVGFRDALRAMRQYAGTSLVLGVASTLAVVVFSTNIVIGAESGEIAGSVFAMLAAYAIVGVAMYLICAWPIVVDPLREDLSLGTRLKLALLVVAGRPGRILILTVVIAAVLVVSTVLFATLLTISVAYVSLVTTRYVLPAADRLEGRATLPLPT